MSDSIANATKNVQNALANQARANEAVRLALIALTLAVSSEQAAQEAGQEAAESTHMCTELQQRAIQRGGGMGVPTTRPDHPTTQPAPQPRTTCHPRPSSSRSD